MGFLKRFFSLRNKQKAARADCRTDPDNLQPPGEHQDWNTRVSHHALDDRVAFRSKSPEDDAMDGDADATISRLLRSSSANYKIVKEADYTRLPPLPHPINTVSSRSTSALTVAPTRSASVQGSYRVTVHKRQQLSTTVFPNAYPPVTPRRPGIAHTSTPNLLATYDIATDVPVSASTSTSALFDPRKVPITPRDRKRLSGLRKDPSVASLLNMYDDHGRIAENAFTNTPAPPRRRVQMRSRRKSTFSELLGCAGATEADLQWAESCIARRGEGTSDKSFSNTSTSSLSSIDTPPLDSPATSTFNDFETDREVYTPVPGIARDPSASTVTGLEKEDGFSSLVVELSVATSAASVDSDDRPAPYLGPYRYSREDKGKGKERFPEKSKGPEWQRSNAALEKLGVDSEQPDQTLGSKMGRRPTQRASQIFNFIAERRERRKSQELLQGSGILVSDSNREPTHTGDPTDSVRLAVQSATISRARSPSPLLILSGNTSSRTQVLASSGHVQDTDPTPSPPSPVTLRPLGPAPRSNLLGKSNSCSQASGAAIVRVASTASTATLPTSSSALLGRPAKGSTGALLILQAERARVKEERRSDAAQRRDVQMLPQMSTPHPSKVAHPKSSMKVSFAPGERYRGRAMLGEVTNARGSGEDLEFDPASIETRYDVFAASLDARTEQLQMREKENVVRRTTRRRGATIDLGLTRAATTTLMGAPTTKNDFLDVPHTPTRCQSLRGPEVPIKLSSELSPETADMMADLRARRAHAQARASRGKQMANAV